MNIIAGDQCIKDGKIHLFIEYEELLAIDYGNILKEFHELYEDILTAKEFQKYFAIYPHPSLAIDSIHTGNSVITVFFEKIVDDVAKNIPRKFGISLLVLFVTACAIMKIQQFQLNNSEIIKNKLEMEKIGSDRRLTEIQIELQDLDLRSRKIKAADENFDALLNRIKEEFHRMDLAEYASLEKLDSLEIYIDRAYKIVDKIRRNRHIKGLIINGVEAELDDLEERAENRASKKS